MKGSISISAPSAAHSTPTVHRKLVICTAGTRTPPACARASGAAPAGADRTRQACSQPGADSSVPSAAPAGPRRRS
jgi:hypothetical protein